MRGGFRYALLESSGDVFGQFMLRETFGDAPGADAFGQAADRGGLQVHSVAGEGMILPCGEEFVAVLADTRGCAELARALSSHVFSDTG